MMNDQEKAILERPNFAHLATLNPDGSPHVAPVWYDLHGKEIWVNTARGRVKERNIANDPRVALSVHDQKNPYSMVSIQGKVSEVTEEGAIEHIDALAKRYLDKDEYPYKSPDEQRVIVKIVPRKVASMLS